SCVMPRTTGAAADDVVVGAVAAARWPEATSPMRADVSAFKACVPGVAPFDARMNAVIARYCASARLGAFGGIVPCMYSKRSWTDRPRHVFMNVPPARGGASFRPTRSGMWQPAQFAWYADRPASA